MQCIIYTVVAAVIPCIYVGSLYLVENKLRSNHPHTLRKRFRAVSIVCAFSVVLSYILLKLRYDDPLDKMGFHWYGTIASLLLPTFLTMIFYTGTLLMIYMDGSYEMLFSAKEWKKAMNNIQWIRHIIMGPLTEEIAFRACGASLILQCFPGLVTTFVYPMFFSLCHMHHVLDDLNGGLPLKSAVLYRLFQSSYTYLFGVYVTYIFTQTGHILGPILVHSFCNTVGLPSVWLNACTSIVDSRNMKILDKVDESKFLDDGIL
ncbi:hypothetical protein FO519_007699 [Halicephalobus sp. NKZ332]|nr:hypothetical protein FO519_007699 [Halicephalobus sp. NKZ332]